MATNQYHLLHRIPAIEAWEMPPALEALAQRLVQSGLLRIHADAYRNYVRYGTVDRDLTFTARELTDPALWPRTRTLLMRLVPPAAGTQGIDDLRSHLRSELRKARGIEAEKEARVARVVVQATHPSVIALILQNGTAVYVSYAHQVADLLAVHEWQTHGTASGLQATSEEGTAVYISCGGDPFFEGEQKTYTTDGFPALARMMVIGGQELGHFADLRRVQGNIVGRYSTDPQTPRLRAAPAVKAARRADMAHLTRWQQAMEQAGLGRLAQAEQAVAFYEKQRQKFGLAWCLRQLWRGVCYVRFRQRAPGPWQACAVYPRQRYGQAMAMFFSDMRFNLAPDADVYRRSDPEEEEAIACIEALARVPQQVHKWGHAAVQRGWPGLYAVYYGQVIPGCVQAAGVALPTMTQPWPHRARACWHRLRRAKPGYYPDK